MSRRDVSEGDHDALFSIKYELLLLQLDPFFLLVLASSLDRIHLPNCGFLIFGLLARKFFVFRKVQVILTID